MIECWALIMFIIDVGFYRDDQVKFAAICTIYLYRISVFDRM